VSIATFNFFNVAFNKVEAFHRHMPGF